MEFEKECRKREEKAFKMAKETIATIQQQLKRKEETILKYQNMLKEARKEIVTQKEVIFFSFLFRNTFFM